MINFKREYIGLEQDRLLYPVSFTDKAKCNVYGRKKFITEAGEVQLSAHVFLISKDFWTFNAGQLDFTNYPNGIWNDYISIDIIEKDEYTAPSINFGSMGDITPENLQGLSDYISKHLSDLEKRIVEDYLFIDEGVSENIELPNLPENHFWARRNGVIVGVNLDYLKADYEHLKNELWKNYESFNEKLQAALKKYYDDLELQMNNFFKDLIEKIREEAEKQLGLIAGAGGGLLHKIGQVNHGFIFDPIVYENGVWKKATTTSGTDGMGVVISANTFFFLEAGEIEVPQGATDKDGQPLLDDEYYYMNEDGGTGFQKEEPVWFYQPLFHTRTYKGKLLANVHIDTMEDLRGQVVDTESGRTHGIALWGDIVPKFDTIEKLQKAFWLKEGEVVEVLGYYSAGDGANHKRIIKAEDDGSGVQVANNLWACIVHNGEVNVSWFGDNLEKFLNYKCKQHIIDNVVTINKEIIIDYKIHLKFINSSFINYTTKEAHILIKPNVQNVDGHILLENFRAKTNILVNKSITIDGVNIPFWSESANATLKKQVVINNMEICSFDDKIGTTGFDVGLSIKKFWGVYITNYSFKGMENKSYAGLVVQGSNVSCYTYLTNLNINWCKYAVLFTDHLEGVYLNVFDFISVNYGIQAGFLDDRFSEQAENNQTVVQLNVDNGHIDLNNSENTNCIKLKEIFQGSFKNLNLYCSQSDTTTTEMIYIEKGEFNVLENIKIINNSKSKDVIGVNCKSILSSFNNIWAKELLAIAKINGRQNDFNNNFGYNLKYLYIFDKEMDIGNKFSGANKTINNTILTTVDYITLNTEIEKVTYNETKIFNAQSPSKTHLVHFVPYNLTKKENIVANEVSSKFLKTRYAYDSSLENDIVVEVSDIRDIEINWDFRVNISYEDYSFKIINQEQMLKNLNITLNSYYYTTKMQQENVYDDYISYMDEKTAYDKQQRKLEQDRQLAYEEVLKENPNLTYEEFMSVQPMTLNFVEEPQPSQALKDFMEKYL